MKLGQVSSSHGLVPPGEQAGPGATARPHRDLTTGMGPQHPRLQPGSAPSHSSWFGARQDLEVMLGSAAVTQCWGIAPAPGCGWGSKEVALGKWCWTLGLDGPRAKKNSRNRPRKESQIVPNSQRGSGKQFPKCIPCFTPRCVSLRASVCVRAVALVTWPGMGSAACPSHPWAKKMPHPQTASRAPAQTEHHSFCHAWSQGQCPRGG